MVRTLLLVIVIMVVGYAIMHACIGLYYKMKREEDEDLQYRKDVTKELQDATEDLRDEQTRMDRRKQREDIK